MSKQTAVEWFYDKIKSHFEHDGDLLEALTFTMAIAKAKEREERSEQLVCNCQGCGEVKKIEYCEKCYAENLPDIAN